MNRPFTIIIFLIVFALTNCRDVSVPQFQLEKIIFHSIGKGCEGYCNDYHLEIDSNRVVKLFAEKVYKPFDEIERIFEHSRRNGNDTVYPDSLLLKTQTGYFTAIAADSTYSKLKKALKDINLNSLEYKNVLGYDGINKTLIVYYNEKRKVLRAMFPPDSTKLIYQSLYNIIRQNNFTRCDSFPVDLRDTI